MCSGFSQLVTTKRELLAAGVMQGAGVREEFDLEVLRSVSLGFGQSSDDEDDKHKKMAWTFLGFVSLVDPPRDSVPDMIQICREASIQVVMATGDHPLIAKSNARRIGIIRGDTWIEFERRRLEVTGGNPDLITDRQIFQAYSHHEWFGLQKRYPEVEAVCVFSPTLTDSNDDDWRYCLRLHQVVFARCQPEQKKQIVIQMQRLHELNANAVEQLKLCRQMLLSMTCVSELIASGTGSIIQLLVEKLEQSTKDELIAEIDELIRCEELSPNRPKVVAVTGDGVADAAALKVAHCGIAMGISGSDVSKESADVILLDDNISSFVRIVEEGRELVYRLQRLFVYTLSSSIPELAAVVFTVTLGIPLPLPATMMLWIDMVLNILLGSSMNGAHVYGMMRGESTGLDQIATSRVFRFAYCQIGLMQAVAAMGSYLLVFSHEGISLGDLRGTVSQYNNQNFQHVCGLDYDSRLELLASAQTAYLITVTVMQLANAICCSHSDATGKFSICMNANFPLSKSLMLGLLKGFAVTLLVVYLPMLQSFIGTRSAGLSVWCYSAFCALFAWSCDEIRKYALRKEFNKKGDSVAMGCVEQWASY